MACFHAVEFKNFSGRAPTKSILFMGEANTMQAGSKPPVSGRFSLSTLISVCLCLCRYLLVENLQLHDIFHKCTFAYYRVGIHNN
jgi:hypothetical protein